MKKIKQQTKFTILPSACEGFGWSLREAIKDGSAVITTNAPPMNEYFKHKQNALLIEATPYSVGQGTFVNINPIYSVVGQCGSEAFALNQTSFEDVINQAINLPDSEYLTLKARANVDFEQYNAHGRRVLSNLCNL